MTEPRPVWGRLLSWAVCLVPVVLLATTALLYLLPLALGKFEMPVGGWGDSTRPTVPALVSFAPLVRIGGWGVLLLAFRPCRPSAAGMAVLCWSWVGSLVVCYLLPAFIAETPAWVR